MYIFAVCVRSRVFVQLDRLSPADVFLPHHRLTVRRISRLRIVTDEVDAHRQTLHRSCFARELLAVVADNGIRSVPKFQKRKGNGYSNFFLARVPRNVILRKCDL